MNGLIKLEVKQPGHINVTNQASSQVRFMFFIIISKARLINC